MSLPDPLRVSDTVSWGNERATIFRPERLAGVDPARLARRPRTVRVLLENILRHFDPKVTDPSSLVALANGSPIPDGTEFAYYPERVLLQDFTGIPVVVDLSTLRNAAVRHGIDPRRVNPVVPVDLIIDHSVQVDSFGSPRSIAINLDREYERNGERYRFLRWSKDAYTNVHVVPPGNGICHQVNLEHLSTVVQVRGVDGQRVAFPDTVIGTDSHTTMVNGVSVLSWGVGGIEAEAVMLGEPYFLARPVVVGVELTGALPEGATATDLVLTVTRRLREKGVVDRFVEFFGPGVGHLSVPDRATVSNMCPEYGATAALFPIDEATVAYLRGTGRSPELVARVEAYARAQGLWGSPSAGSVDYDDLLRIDLGSIVPMLSGPKNPEEAVPLAETPSSFRTALAGYRKGRPPSSSPSRGPSTPPVDDGSVVIAAITSCTNTSNPSVMVGAGLIAKRAVELGLSVPPHVKTSLAPGSKVVTGYLERAGLLPYLDQLGFEVVGYGCTTCIGNSGPLLPAVSQQVKERDLFVAAVLSGNRNFEARIHNEVRANYLASPMLVVAYALAGRIDIDLTREPIGKGPDGRPVHLRDLWPPAEEVRRIVESSIDASLFAEKYRTIEVGDHRWEALDPPTGPQYQWSSDSTYLAVAPYLELPPPWLPREGTLAQGVRALVVLGDRVSTDHISPAGEIPLDSPAGKYLTARGVPASEFNTYGSRRGHHEVMIRGTFANVRLKNELGGGREGGYTLHSPSGTTTTVFEAAERYRAEGTPLIVLAGKSYGQGSSRDWAAKGPRLLGVGAVIAESYERIHRTNLIEMGVLPLQFLPGEGWKQLGLTGRESFALRLPAGGALAPGCTVEVVAISADGSSRTFTVRCRINSTTELDYYRAGGVLPYVMAHRFSS
ncbi:MAG TPA: aconitate hydratase AcnA [Thermoplasmata archaeon]|nr:aconitate hydratase AcnA [Thermoplasmata archaeon]